MQRGSVVIFVLVAILVSAGLAVAGYYYAKCQYGIYINGECHRWAPPPSLWPSSSPPQNPVVVSQTPQPTSTTSASQDETADWKIFNSKYGYLLKYPANWDMKTGSWVRGSLRIDLPEGVEALMYFTDKSQPLYNGIPYITEVSFYQPKENATGLSLRQWAQNLYGNQVKIEDISIGGEKAVKISEGLKDDSTVILISRGSKVYRITNVPYPTDKPLIKEYKKIYGYDAIFNQILSTFKFIDQNGSTCGTCPQLMPSAPDFCKDGTIVPGEKDACGCQKSPQCNTEVINNGQFCGGFAGKLCPSGYTCKLDGKYPDAGGKCIKE